MRATITVLFRVSERLLLALNIRIVRQPLERALGGRRADVLATLLLRFRFDVAGQVVVLPKALLTISPAESPTSTCGPRHKRL